MSLTLALSNALSGLEVSQNALSTTSNNIANANTEGYSRQIVDQSAVTINDIGNGVQVADISRRVDVYLERTISSEIYKLGYNEVVDDYYDRMQILYGEPGANKSIYEYFEN
ncbi:MAG: flagellar basal body protein, partial [Rickettsiales bacterium]|nr:flagellar basal body protein [Rickettsiales bacterium]